MTGWTGQAHLLADAIREPGFACAALNAAAWSAGVNPEATAGLIGAATALTGGDCGPQLWERADPLPSDQELLTAAAELEGAVVQLLAYATTMAQGCRAELASAVTEAARALAALESAETPQARTAAESALQSARAVIGDCEAALEVIDEAGSRLAHAANCLRRVPDDLAGTYETPYAFVHDGGKLPHDGEFLLAGISYEAT